MGLPARRIVGNYTYADYKIWNHGERWEIISGEAWDMSPAPSRNHQWLVMEMGRQFANYLQDKSCQIYPAPFDVFFADENNQAMDKINNIVQPDLTLVCDKKKLNDRGCMGSPDLVIEILSPYTSKKDLDEKFHLYERSGVEEYWVVDPGSCSLQAYSLDESGKYINDIVFVHEGIIRTKFLKDFSINLADLFSRMSMA